MLSNKEIERLYFDEKLSAPQIAEILNCATGSVRHRLGQLDKKPRTVSEAAILRNTEEYIEKLSLSQAGEKARSAKLTDIAVLAIRKEYEESLQGGAQKSSTQYYLAEKYNVKRPTISDVVLRKTWKHI